MSSPDQSSAPANGDESVLFEAALRLQGPARRAFLQQACSGDSTMLLRMLTLVAAHEKDADFLATAVVDGRQLEPFPSEIPASPPSTEEFAGRFKLLEKIGEGGCGEVYVAEQILPVRRRVALKLIKLGMDTKSVIARFEAERQALALMDHPNIARVLDAGATSLGRPFFVMELVRGVKITEYCDTNRLDIAQRLELFAKVCHAIQHAHQKGIIHRDIKPSNILVTLHDGVPVPKVIDFGIAKATEGRLTDATLYTQLQQFIGTPAYMSPEQAEMSGLDIDTRTDVYSLGVLLYELLTGRTPFDAKELVNQGIDQMRKIIREVEPKRPSTRLSTMEGAVLATTAEAQRTLAPQLIRRVQGDLDWIVMKCLEKDRTRRYETANGLASDIHRHLNNEPVVARPPSAAYRFGKAYRRNRGAFAAIGAVALALVIGIIAATWQAILANRAREAAMASDRQSKASEQRALQAEADQTVLRKQADQQTLKARRMAYNSDMLLASQALIADDFGRVDDLLTRHRPRPGQHDFREWEWRYLWNESRPDPHRVFDSLPATPATMGRRMSFGGGGRWLAMEDPGGISVRDLDSNRLIYQRADAVAPAFSPDGTYLYMGLPVVDTSEQDPNFSIIEANLNTATERVIAKVRIAFIAGTASPRPSRRWFGNLLVSPDGQSLIALSFQAAQLRNNSPEDFALVANRWRIQSGEEEWRHEIPQKTGTSGEHAAISGDGRFWIGESGSGDSVLLLDAHTGKRLGETRLPDQFVTAVAFSPDASEFLVGTGYLGGEIHVFETATGSARKTLNSHKAWVNALRFDSSGTRLYSASADSTIRIWDWSSRRVVRTIHGHHGEVQQIELPRDGSRLASCSKEGTVILWDQGPAAARTSHRVLPGAVSRNHLTQVAISDDSRLFFGISPLGGINVWDLSTGQIVRHPFAGRTNLSIVGISPNGNYAAAVNPGGLSIPLLLDVKTEEPLSLFDTMDSIAAMVTFASHDTAFVEHWPRAEDGTRTRTHLELWDLRKRQRIALEKQVTRPSLSRASSSGRSLLIYQDRFRELGWLNLSKPDPFETTIPFNPSLATGIPNALDLSPDLTKVFGCFADGSIALWNLSPQMQLFRRKSFRLGSKAATFLPSGQRAAATGNGTETVKMFDTETYQEVLALEGIGSLQQRLLASPDDSFLISVTDSGSLQLWQAPSLKDIELADREWVAATQRSENDQERFYLSLLASREAAPAVASQPLMRNRKWLRVALLKSGHGAAISQAIKPRPGIAKEDDVHPWLALTTLQLLFRQTAEYERLCAELLPMAEGSGNPLILQRAAAAASMARLDNTNLLVRALAMARKSEELSQVREHLPWMLQAEGALEYRLGSLDRAEALIAKASKAAEAPVLLMICSLYHALILNARGETELARAQLLDIRQNWVKRGMPPPPKDLGLITMDQIEEWHDYQLTWLLLRELAEALGENPN